MYEPHVSLGEKEMKGKFNGADIAGPLWLL